MKAKIILLSLFVSVCLNAQLTQTIRGVVVDLSSNSPIGYASVAISAIGMGAMSDSLGQFQIRNVPIGRHTLTVSYLGYDPTIIKEILLSSTKETYLEIRLKESTVQLDEVVIRPNVNKEQALNKMALSGARMLSVEEASRYAGGMDDPSRLVSSFAGVASSLTNNGISIHGNAPHLLQWRLEGVEIPNPNHFADVSVLGGGILSSLSSNVLGNSDFFTGAFPAEYANAVSGIFDMKLRNGNNRNHEHTLQLGILGIDIASEGSLFRNTNSSYIFNYRYSTTGLMGKIFPQISLGGVLDYQDLNFKFHFPTKKAGVFSFWGTGRIDKVYSELENVRDWKYKDDGKLSSADQKTLASGLGHYYFFDANTFLKTTIAYTHSGMGVREDLYDSDLNATPYLTFNTNDNNFIFSTYLNKKFSRKHSNQSGLSVTQLFYDMDLDISPYDKAPLQNISKSEGNTTLLSAYSNSAISLSDRLSLNIGLSAQLPTLNNRWTIEPRVGTKWLISEKSSVALAYGLHSRMERMDVYFVRGRGTDDLPNKKLDFTKAHHLSLSYSYKISEDMNIRIEPYFQRLYDVPVIADSSYSVLNRTGFYMDNILVSRGKGQNMGVDLTFEKYLVEGLYYMLAASVFDSKYCGGDGVWHDTRFNRRFIVNGLIGKEWTFGKNKQSIIGANIKLTVQGGDRYAPVDESATRNDPQKKVHYDESNAYSEQFKPMFIANYTINYKLSKKSTAHEFAIKGINLTQCKEYYGHEYNFLSGVIEPNMRAASLVNLSYKFEF